MKTMKKIMMAMFVMACVGLSVSCNKDNDNSNGGGNGGNDVTLAGTWQISSLLLNGQDMTSMLPQMQITLNANGTGNVVIAGVNNAFSWSATDSSLTVTTESETINCSIVSLTANECTLTSSNMSFPGIGQIPGNVTITLTKVGGDNPNPNPDTNANNYSTLIVGTWQTTQVFVNGQDVSAMVGSVLLTFTADGRGLLNHNGETQNNGFSWHINGTTMFINPDHDSGAEFTIVTLDGNTCTFTGTVMPGGDETYDEVRITMVKTNNPNPNPNPNPDSDALVGTQWGYHFENSYTTESYGEQEVTIAVNIDLLLNFNTISTGIVNEDGTMSASMGGTPIHSEDIDEDAPFNYTYNETSHSGTIVATITNPETHTTETSTMSFTVSGNTLTLVNSGYQSSLLPETLVFHRTNVNR